MIKYKESTKAKAVIDRQIRLDLRAIRPGKTGLLQFRRSGKTSLQGK